MGQGALPLPPWLSLSGHWVPHLGMAGRGAEPTIAAVPASGALVLPWCLQRVVPVGVGAQCATTSLGLCGLYRLSPRSCVGMLQLGPR